MDCRIQRRAPGRNSLCTACNGCVRLASLGRPDAWRVFVFPGRLWVNYYLHTFVLEKKPPQYGWDRISCHTGSTITSLPLLVLSEGLPGQIRPGSGFQLTWFILGSVSTGIWVNMTQNWVKLTQTRNSSLTFNQFPGQPDPTMGRASMGHHIHVTS